MRVALVSPYSWTYPGGVTRHIEALATELDRAGHEVRVLAPYDPDTRRSALAHLRAHAAVRQRAPAGVRVVGREHAYLVARSVQLRGQRLDRARDPTGVGP